MSRHGELVRTYTARGLPRYELEIWHDELNKYQVIKGDDSYVVEQKAAAKMAQWDEMWIKKATAETKRAERERAARNKEQKKALAEDRTKTAQQVLDGLEKTLAFTLGIDDAIDWESLKDTTSFPKQKPAKPTPPPLPAKPTIPPEPMLDSPAYVVQLGFLDKIVASRRERKEVEAKARFERDHTYWTKKKEETLNTYDAAVKVRYAKVQEQKKKHEHAVEQWEIERAEYLNKQEETNAHIDEKRREYLEGDLNALIDYCEMVLNNSAYPEEFPQTFELSYNPENQILVVDYQLPAPNNIPTLKEVKYVQSRDEFDEKHISQAQLNKLYDGLLYQITLRTVHELFEADRADLLIAVVFNGWVRSIDPATGHEKDACVLSLQASKDEFMVINLANIDPKLCFKNLKGVGSSKLHSMTPVAPILMIDKDDSRFTDSYDVAHELDEGYNLAAMDWEDFEHLIRELFQKEFSEAGGEVKVTQASRDGGIDAVVFDPDPIRGGKIVIQAKRYTNTVGVSAVRDLYGTVMNEGANKGILVTTSDYGPDAYEFARGKPLTLLNGGNLLHLLAKHGHEARIDLKEAKRIAAERAKEGS